MEKLLEDWNLLNDLPIFFVPNQVMKINLLCFLLKALYVTQISRSPPLSKNKNQTPHSSPLQSSTCYKLPPKKILCYKTNDTFWKNCKLCCIKAHIILFMRDYCFRVWTRIPTRRNIEILSLTFSCKLYVPAAPLEIPESTTSRSVVLKFLRFDSAHIYSLSI